MNELLELGREWWQGVWLLLKVAIGIFAYPIYWWFRRLDGDD
jgi:hypothetical protein